jgi:hypothetical protein
MQGTTQHAQRQSDLGKQAFVNAPLLLSLPVIDADRIKNNNSRTAEQALASCIAARRDWLTYRLSKRTYRIKAHAITAMRTAGGMLM